MIHVEYDGDANNRAVFNAAKKQGGHHRDFLFENITIEDPDVWRLFKFNMTGDSKVSDTTFRNLRLASPPRHSNEMSGDIQLQFDNVTVNGKPIHDAAALGFKSEDRHMVSFD